MGKLKRMSRHYTFCFSLGKDLLELTDNLIAKYKSEEGKFKARLDIESETVRLVDAFPKNYRHKKAFSSFLHRVDHLSFDNKFTIEGPMVGLYDMSGVWTEPTAWSLRTACSTDSWHRNYAVS